MSIVGIGLSMSLMRIRIPRIPDIGLVVWLVALGVFIVALSIPVFLPDQ